MKQFIIGITFLLCLALALCEIHMVVLKFYPIESSKEYAFWLDKNHKEKISSVWYIYEVSNILSKLIWAFCFSKVADLVSHRLSKVLIVFIIYYITQLIFYVWDRNTLLFSNLIVYIYVGMAILFLFIPAKRGGKLINIEDY